MVPPGPGLLRTAFCSSSNLVRFFISDRLSLMPLLLGLLLRILEWFSRAPLLFLLIIN